MKSAEHLFIVGAGFSANAGLPLTTGFTKMLLDVVHHKPEGPSIPQVEFLRKFVGDTFNVRDGASPEDWPELEDIFTCVDLSANTGHHLGVRYSPSDLRTVRRTLIVRTIRMLRETYNRRKKSPDDNWGTIAAFFAKVPTENAAFLSMNWDNVIEEGLHRAQGECDFDYGCEAIAAKFTGANIDVLEPLPNSITILKPHGSVNWLYCDSCRQLFWFPTSQTKMIAVQLFKQSDWQVISKSLDRPVPRSKTVRSCPVCESQGLGTRFATFSYRKALDFPMHARSWLSAEHLLRNAKNWIFIGYSLPAADYEFKHLLKRVELSRKNAPNIVLVTYGDQALKNYKRFFGPQFSAANGTYFNKGIGGPMLEHLVQIGALK
jgi:NAD-dependent SIR2 family protein deacetylase